MVNKNDYIKFFKKEVQTRFKTILKILNEQDSDSAVFEELKKQSTKLSKEFQVKLTKDEALIKFEKILELMKSIQKQLYSFEKANTLIIEYCDLVNNLLGKKALYFKMATPKKKRQKYQEEKKKKELKNKKIKDQAPETIEIIVKTKKQRHFLKIAAIILIILMTVPFFIPSGEMREYTVHIFPKTVNMTVNMTEDTILAKYANKTIYTGASLDIKGKIEYVRETNKYNVQTYNIYLIDNESNKVLLNWIKRNDLAMLTIDGITKEYFLVSGDYDYIEYNTGINGPILYVNNIEKTNLESWEEIISKRVPAEDVIREKELSVGMRIVYEILDKHKEKFDVEALLIAQKTE